MKQTAIQHAEKIQKDGYTLLKTQFSAQDAYAAIQEYHAFTDGLPNEVKERHRKPDGFLARLSNFHSVSDALQRIYIGSELYYNVARLFFGCRPPAISTSLFFANGTEQPIHRDSPAFCTLPEGEFLGCWFALEEATEENGALVVVRGGHLLTEDEFKARREIRERIGGVEDGGQNRLWSEYQNFVQETIARRGLEAKSIEAEVGDVIIWHGHLPHGGGRIKDTSKSRYSCVFHVTPVGNPVFDHKSFWYPDEGYSARSQDFCEIGSSGQFMRRSQPAFPS